MAPLDSDSSDDGTDDYTTTNILLGYAAKEPTDDTISQLGGHPSWLEPTQPPSATLASCKVCNDLMQLLLQLHADLPEHFPGHERRLHLFGCKRRTCRQKEGSVRAIRSTRVTQSAAKATKAPLKEKVEPVAPRRDLGTDLFGGAKSPSASANPFSMPSGNANPFSTSSNPFSANSFAAPQPVQPSTQPPPAAPIASTDSSADLPATFAEKARLSSPSYVPVPSVPWPSALPSPYPAYYLDADYETLDGAPKLTADAAGPSTSSLEDAAPDEPDAYESNLDKTFQRFADRLEQNPLQILRYEFRGTPLLYSKADAVGARLAPHQHHGESGSKVSTVGRAGSTGIPACQNCGGQRVFELQVTPQAIAELEAEEEGVEGMEWGTLILGVCGKDCEAVGVEKGEVGFLEEWVGVQWEDVGKK